MTEVQDKPEHQEPVMDRRFRVIHVRSTPNPQQAIWLAMHQDYCCDPVMSPGELRKMPIDEAAAGVKIIDHLLKGNRGHFGCLEHPSLTFNAQYFPHSTMQQLRTHRVGMCLSGDTQVYTKTASGAIRKICIRDLYNRWTNGRPHQQSEKDANYTRRRVSSISVYNLNEETLEFGTTSISDIYANGAKHVYLVKTSEGQSIKASQDHLFFTDKGWVKLGDLSPGDNITTRCFAGKGKRPFVPTVFAQDIDNEEWRAIPDAFGYEASSLGRIRSFHARNGKGMTSHARIKTLSESKYLFYSANGKRRNVHVDVLTAFRNAKPDKAYIARHLDGNSYNNRIENLAWGTEKDNREDQGKTTGFNHCKARFVPIVSIEYIGEEETYDLEVVGPYHNFLANDLVVHNSFDVQSFRYTSQMIIDVATGKRDVEEVFYVRPVGSYVNRQGKKYLVTEEKRTERLSRCLRAALDYVKDFNEDMPEEDARGTIPFDIRQHWVCTVNARSAMHLLDLRWKADAQKECQWFCDLLFELFRSWCPQLGDWYRLHRAHRALLAP